MLEFLSEVRMFLDEVLGFAPVLRQVIEFPGAFIPIVGGHQLPITAPDSRAGFMLPVNSPRHRFFSNILKEREHVHARSSRNWAAFVGFRVGRPGQLTECGHDVDQVKNLLAANLAPVSDSLWPMGDKRRGDASLVDESLVSS